MTDNELLFAISNIIEPVRDEVRELRKEVREVKTEIRGVKDELQEVKSEVWGIKNELQEVKARVSRIELTLENEIRPRLNTIESCYTSTYDRYRDNVEDFDSTTNA